jgi:uncharacterized protein (TIGR00251 family)
VWSSANGAIALKIKVSPNAQRDSIANVANDELIIKINAAPEKGRANAALIAFMAKTFKIAKRDIIIASGESARRKLLRMPDTPILRERLEALSKNYAKDKL